MRAVPLSLVLIVAVACGSPRPATTPEPALPPCTGTRVLIVQNSSDEGVIVYALNGRTSTEIGAAPIGRKEIVVQPSVRATSFYAIAASRNAIAGSAQSAPVDSRVIFTLECRK